MDIRKKYWKKIEKALLNNQTELGVKMIMALMSNDVKEAALLFKMFKAVVSKESLRKAIGRKRRPSKMLLYQEKLCPTLS